MNYGELRLDHQCPVRSSHGSSDVRRLDPATFKSDQLGSDGKAVEEAMKDPLDRAKALHCSSIKCLCARACHCLG